MAEFKDIPQALNAVTQAVINDALQSGKAVTLREILNWHIECAAHICTSFDDNEDDIAFDCAIDILTWMRDTRHLNPDDRPSLSDYVESKQNKESF